MEIQFLGQGYEALSENAVGNHLAKLLVEKGFQSFTVLSAFISEAGVNGLAKYIAETGTDVELITIITGVDQQGTSKEALEALMALNVNAYVFYQPSMTIFHPKIYLFEGAEKSALIIGSSNLTAQGLFNNIEASFLIRVSTHDEKGMETIHQLKNYYKGLFDLTDPNLKKLDQDLINFLVKTKVVPTAEERKATSSESEAIENKQSRKGLYDIFPKRIIAKIPSFFRKKRKSSLSPLNKSIAKKALKEQVANNQLRLLLWESNPLTKRDLNIPTGKNTNPTGSMLFKKGKQVDIDQRHFFRNQVFQTLNWQYDTRPNLSHLERAKAMFKIIVQGVDKGNFELKLTHNSKTTTKTYLQKNSMTAISWGSAKSVIAKQELIGKTVKLYESSINSSIFVLDFS
ncbi:MAG: phospholipase D-like domain-containing protein [Chitinophagales bacterium]